MCDSKTVQTMPTSLFNGKPKATALSAIADAFGWPLNKCSENECDFANTRQQQMHPQFNKPAERPAQAARGKREYIECLTQSSSSAI